MKKILLIIILISYNKLLFSNDLFNSSFYEVEFISNQIEDEKINKINEIKKDSIEIIFEKTLIEKQYSKFKNNLSNDLINTFIKNVIIEDEKIINNKYLSKIKVNFDKKKIIHFYRTKKIPYVEYLPDKILLVIIEENEIGYNFFSEDNSFYSYYKKNLKKDNLFMIPNLDINDRYILKKKHIDNNNMDRIINFSKKYNIDDVVLVNAKINNNKVKYDIALFSDGELVKKNLNFYKYKFNKFYKILENETIDIWKDINQIQNNSLNTINCKVNYLNILELKEIRDNLDKISIIKNILVKSISYNSIEYDIFYFGNLKLLSNILNLNYLKINENTNSCNIRLK